MSGNIGFSLRNWWDMGTLSGGSWTLPLSNSQSTDRSLIARCASTSSAHATADCDMGTDRDVSVVCMAGHNMVPADSWKVQLGTTSGAHDVYDGAGQTAWSMTFALAPLLWEAPNWWGPQVRDWGHPYCAWLLLPQAYAARYVRLQWTCASPVQFARLWVGSLWQPLRDAAYGLEHGWQDPSETQRSYGGNVLTTKRRRYRTARLTFAAAEEADAAMAGEVARHCGTVEELLYVPRPADYSYTQRYGGIVRVRQLQPATLFTYGLHSAGFDFEEWI